MKQRCLRDVVGIYTILPPVWKAAAKFTKNFAKSTSWFITNNLHMESAECFTILQNSQGWVVGNSWRNLQISPFVKFSSLSGIHNSSRNLCAQPKVRHASVVTIQVSIASSWSSTTARWSVATASVDWSASTDMVCINVVYLGCFSGQTYKESSKNVLRGNFMKCVLFRKQISHNLTQ